MKKMLIRITTVKAPSDREQPKILERKLVVVWKLYLGDK